MNISDFLKTIISEFIEKDNELTIDSEELDDVTVLTIIPSSTLDIAKIIGKDGRTISALRVIMRAIYNSKNSENAVSKKLRITVKDIRKSDADVVKGETV